MTLLHQLDSPLVRRALLEAVLVGALCGAVGAHVLLRRLPFFTLALSHATFPGVVLASLAGISLYVGGAAAALVLVVAVGVIGSTKRLEASTATGVALSGAFALGVLVQSAQPAPSHDLSAFLVGDVLTVDKGDLVTTALVGIVVVAVLVAFHKELVFGAFDADGAAAAGYPTTRLDLLVLAVVALTVVTSIQAVGTILVVALLVTPALSARLLVERVGPMMVVGAALGALSGVGGIAASAQWDVAGGAAIALTAAALLVVTLAARTLRSRWPRSTRTAPRTAGSLGAA
jgi:manganese/iron transport system permease protein